MTSQDPSPTDQVLTEEEFNQLLDDLLEIIEATEDDQNDPSVWEQK
jgi:hypothetical protein